MTMLRSMGRLTYNTFRIEFVVYVHRVDLICASSERIAQLFEPSSRMHTRVRYFDSDCSAAHTAMRMQLPTTTLAIAIAPSSQIASIARDRDRARAQIKSKLAASVLNL